MLFQKYFSILILIIILAIIYMLFYGSITESFTNNNEVPPGRCGYECGTKGNASCSQCSGWSPSSYCQGSQIQCETKCSGKWCPPQSSPSKCQAGNQWCVALQKCTLLKDCPENVCKCSACQSAHGSPSSNRKGSDGANTNGANTNGAGGRLNRQLPLPIKGWYLMGWTRQPPPIQDPVSTATPYIQTQGAYNIGIQFNGARPNGDAFKQAAQNKPKISNQIKFLSAGGGIGTGNVKQIWQKGVDIPIIQANLDNIVNNGFDGICFDIEYAGSPNPTIQDFTNIFQECKNKNLMVMVTMGWFGLYDWGGFQPSIKPFAINFASNPYIDIFSPQLYSNNCQDPVWNGTDNIDSDLRQAMQNCKVLAPSINQNTPETIKQITDTINTAFPQNIGTFVFCMG